jgi:6-phosphogluconolactonase (cycloisomerase 2 family)
LIDAREHKIRARLPVGAAPAHLAFSADNECAFIGCESTNEVAVVDLEKQTVVDLINAGRPL